LNSAATQRGLLLLVITTVGWGMNWPAMKVLLAELPPLTTRAIGGGLGFTVLLWAAHADFGAQCHGMDGACELFPAVALGV
jgi:drug/metabolite transporter (DMT)-like permease